MTEVFIIDLLYKSMDWFLYHRDLRHEMKKAATFIQPSYRIIKSMLKLKALQARRKCFFILTPIFTTVSKAILAKFLNNPGRLLLPVLINLLRIHKSLVKFSYRGLGSEFFSFTLWHSSIFKKNIFICLWHMFFFSFFWNVVAEERGVCESGY